MLGKKIGGGHRLCSILFRQQHGGYVDFSLTTQSSTFWILKDYFTAQFNTHRTLAPPTPISRLLSVSAVCLQAVAGPGGVKGGCSLFAFLFYGPVFVKAGF